MPGDRLQRPGRACDEKDHKQAEIRSEHSCPMSSKGLYMQQFSVRHHFRSVLLSVTKRYSLCQACDKLIIKADDTLVPCNPAEVTHQYIY